jgi:flavin reductase (DIM6/NTAB) family NADH-FMN oxidoreductase RutF
VPSLQTAFADAMAQLVSGVCVVTARARSGEPRGFAATSLCAYSAQPPTVLLCVGRRGRASAAVVGAPTFAVHILRAEREDIARWFSTPRADRFAAVDWEWDAGVPALSLDQIVVYLWCARVAVKRHGDHAIVIGEVQRIHNTPSEPLVYRQRHMDWRLMRP